MNQSRRGSQEFQKRLDFPFFYGRIEKVVLLFIFTYLYCKARSYSSDGIFHIHPLIHRNNIWLALSHSLQQSATAADVQDDRKIRVSLPHALDYLLDVGSRKYVKVLRLELRRPAIKDLHCLSTRICLQDIQSDLPVPKLLSEAVLLVEKPGRQGE